MNRLPDRQTLKLTQVVATIAVLIAVSGFASGRFASEDNNRQKLDRVSNEGVETGCSPISSSNGRMFLRFSRTCRF